MTEPIVISLRGPIPSKKNMNRPNKNGKGLHQDKSLKLLLDRLEMQVPGYARDLRLESPELEFQFYYSKANWDLDNGETTILDILVKYGVLANDNIKRLNGKRTTWPAIKAEYPGCDVTIIPAAAGEPTASRYRKPEPRARAFRPSLASPPFEDADIMEDFIDERGDED